MKKINLRTVSLAIALGLGSVAMVGVWKRVLTEAEIRRLREDPFEMFRSRRSIALLAPAPGNVIQCAGSITGSRRSMEP